MYSITVLIHSFFRWLVLLSLLYAIVSSIQGIVNNRTYNKVDKFVRVVAGTICHTQLLIGFTLYFVLSPITGYFIKNGTGENSEISFFGIYHVILMICSIVVMTIGGAKSKTLAPDRDKFKTIAIYYSVALFLILIAIPWFRPLFRNF